MKDLRLQFLLTTPSLPVLLNFQFLPVKEENTLSMFRWCVAKNTLERQLKDCSSHFYTNNPLIASIELWLSEILLRLLKHSSKKNSDCKFIRSESNTVCTIWALRIPSSLAVSSWSVVHFPCCTSRDRTWRVRPCSSLTRRPLSDFASISSE